LPDNQDETPTKSKIKTMSDNLILIEFLNADGSVSSAHVVSANDTFDIIASNLRATIL
jgi:hypothetical protein